VRQHGGFTPGQVSVDCLENLFLRNPLHNPADQDLAEPGYAAGAHENR
jgi:hypothetical protein